MTPTIRQAQADVRWLLASNLSRSLDSLHGAGDACAQQVGAMTGGKFQISVHAGGELVPALGIVDAVQNATVECGHTVPYDYFGKDPTFAIGAAIPFGLNSRQMSAWIRFTEAGFDDFMQQQRL